MSTSTLAPVHPAIPYLKSLFIDEDHIIFQMIHSTNKQVKVVPAMSREQATRPETIARLEELQSEGFNVYVSMNPFPAGTTARQEKFVEQIRNVFIDADADGEKSLALIRADVAAGLIPTPHTILKTSPNKYHVAWHVDGFTPEEARALNRALASRFGGDPAATDLIRILRMPGFKNLKAKYADKPPVCELIEKSDLEPYSREEFKIGTADLEKKLTPRNDRNLIPHGGIHDHLVRQAGKMRYEGHSVEGIENALVDWAHENCELPLDDNHIRQVARSTAGWEQGNPLASAVNVGGKLAGSAVPVATDGKSTSELITRRADSIKMKEVKWLWNHRIPYGKLTILAGNPDQGKSLVTMYIAAQLSSGRPLFGSSVVIPACDVLVMAGEDDASDTVIPRLVAAGADLTRIHTVESITTKDGKGATISERELQLDVDIEKIEATLKAKPDIRLVIIDPLSNYLGRANMNREQEVRQVLIPIKLLADRTGVSIVCVMHLNKSSDASAIHRIGGAVAFTGVARACWLFLEDPADSNRHLMLRVKNNLAKSGGGLAYKIDAKSVALGEGRSSMMPFVEWTGETEEKASDLLIGGNPVGRPDKVGSATEWLAKFLSGGSETADDIKHAGKKLGFSDRTVERALNQAKIENGLVGGWCTDGSKKKKRQWVWWLPGHEPKDAISLDNVSVKL